MIEVGKGQISGITIYNSGANVTREAKIKLVKGLNEVRFSGLSEAYEEVYDVSASCGKVVNCRYDSEVIIKRTDELSARIAELKKDESKFTSQLTILKTESQFWVKNNKSEQSNERELERRAEFIRLKQVSTESKMGEVTEKLDKITEEIDKLTKADTSEKFKTERVCIVSVMSNRACLATISIVGFTYKASWTASYNLYTNGVDSLSVSVQAMARQDTQEEWQGSIKFVTGSPKDENSLEDFESEYIGERFVATTRMMSARANSSYDSADEFDENTENEGVNTICYDLAYPITIKSGHMTVTELKTFDINANFSYNSFASIDTSVYLVANIEPQMFLSGKASVFINNVFSGATYLSDVMSRITIGLESAINIRRIVGNRYTQKKQVDGKKTECGYKLLITSGKTSAVNINIIDRIPVSGNLDLEVTPINLSGGKYSPTTGKLEFELELLPNQEKELNIVYTISKK